MAIKYLPPEILREILLRLPVESLTTTARFVNKCWFGIISSSEFVTARLKKSEEDNTFSNHRVLFNFTTQGFLLQQFSVDYRDSSSINLVNFGYPKRSSPNGWLVGSCNGLICVLSLESRIVVLNPCTGKYNELPPLDLEPRRISYGFGYDESNDDYKVVAVGHSYFEGVGVEKIYCSIVKVYNLKSNSWKRLEDFKGGILGSVVGKLLSGKVHWFADYAGCRSRIVSFDLGGEVFGTIEPPVDDYFYKSVDVLRGCICLLVNYDQSHADMWVMKEYGVKESWTKMVTILYTNVHEKLRLCSLLPNGEILFVANHKSFVVYNPKDGSFKFLDKACLHPVFGQPLIYVQSLVSPICTQG